MINIRETHSRSFKLDLGLEYSIMNGGLLGKSIQPYECPPVQFNYPSLSLYRTYQVRAEITNHNSIYYSTIKIKVK